MFEPKPKEETEKKRPQLSGDVQRVTVLPDGTKQYEKVGSLALWDNSGKSGKQPDMCGNISPPQGKEGETYAVSVWRRGASK